VTHEEDYSTSVKRYFNRNAIISKNNPMLIFVKLDMKRALPDLKPEQRIMILGEMAQRCMKFDIDGIVL